MTQQMLADRLRRSKSWVGKVERGCAPWTGTQSSRSWPRSCGSPRRCCWASSGRRLPAHRTGWTTSEPPSPATTPRRPRPTPRKS
ncbi:hypothetical protein ACLQ3B_26285 [Micromonospora sp. DT53]|uniref:hypothetical protein n=1 Tax=Micromonospora sp. DT53 TaxID=3393444 RepID=UPI003CF4FCCD